MRQMFVALMLLILASGNFSCETEEPEEEVVNNDPNFVADFDYHIYGSNLNFDSELKTFQQTVFVKNNGNISIILDMHDSRKEEDDIFQIGYRSGYPPNTSEYSVTFQKNEFRFGSSKLGHAIEPGGLMTIEVIGIITSSISNAPNSTSLQNLKIYGDRYKDFEDVFDGDNKIIW